MITLPHHSRLWNRVKSVVELYFALGELPIDSRSPKFEIPMAGINKGLRHSDLHWQSSAWHAEALFIPPIALKNFVDP